jgi:hypothetical protein
MGWNKKIFKNANEARRIAANNANLPELLRVLYSAYCASITQAAEF